MSEWKPLDPKEGPTVWGKIDENNPYTAKIRIGTDKNNPRKEIIISKSELDNLRSMF
jgi:hypothetical protein